jgi:hypothetical protein
MYLCNFRRDHKGKFQPIIYLPPLCGGNCTALVLIDRRLFLRRSSGGGGGGGGRLRSVCYRRLGVTIEIISIISMGVTHALGT